MRGGVRLETARVVDALCEARREGAVCGMEEDFEAGEEDDDDYDDDDDNEGGVPAWAAALCGLVGGYVAKLVQASVVGRVVK